MIGNSGFKIVSFPVVIEVHSGRSLKDAQTFEFENLYPSLVTVVSVHFALGYASRAEAGS
jgi:hypothetical protein